MKLREPWTCIFCNGYPISDEHFWPRWCHEFFERGAHDSYAQFSVESTPIAPPKRKEQTRHGHIVTKKIRCVCKKCNNGWMSLLEDLARPIMEPLILGRPCQLSAEDQRTIAEWAVLKSMIGEFDIPKEAVTPDHDRLVFWEWRGIPDYYRIRIGHNASDMQAGFYREAMALSFSPTPTPSTPNPIPPLGRMRKNVHSTVIVIGALLFHVTVTRLDGFNIEDAVRHEDWGLKVFPFGDGSVFDWPPKRALALKDIRLLARSLDYVRAQQNFKWGGYLPGHEPQE